jgi:leucyl-tRNA synthetase
MEKLESVPKKSFEIFLKILSPFAPHISEEIWHNFGNKKLLALEAWPKADPKKLQEFVRLKGQNIAQDKDGNYVFLAESDWILRMNQTNNPEIVFHFTSEFKLA